MSHALHFVWDPNPTHTVNVSTMDEWVNKNEDIDDQNHEEIHGNKRNTYGEHAPAVGYVSREQIDQAMAEHQRKNQPNEDEL